MNTAALFDRLTENEVLGALIALLGAPALLLVAYRVPAWLEQAWEGNHDAVDVLVCRKEKWLDWLLIICWIVLSLATLQFWGVSRAGFAAILLCAGLLMLAHIDLRTGLLPDILTLSLMWLGILFHLWGGWVSLSASVAGAVVGYGLLWFIFRLYKWKTGREGMGYGDFKLTAALGAWLGLQAMPSLLLYASAAGALVGLVLQYGFRLSARTAIPFGPFLVIAGILILFLEYAPFR